MYKEKELKIFIFIILILTISFIGKAEDDWFAKGQKALSENKFDKALTAFTKVIVNVTRADALLREAERPLE